MKLRHYDKDIREAIVALAAEVEKVTEIIRAKGYEPVTPQKVLATVREWLAAPEKPNPRWA